GVGGGFGGGEMSASRRGERGGVLRAGGFPDVAGGPWPPPPSPRVGSPKLMLATLLRPHRVNPWVGASAWLPQGRASHAPLRSMVQALHAHACGPSPMN